MGIPRYRIYLEPEMQQYNKIDRILDMKTAILNMKIFFGAILDAVVQQN